MEWNVFLSLSLFPPPIKHQVQNASGQTACGELLLLQFFPFFPGKMHSIHRCGVLRSALQIEEQGFPFGLCIWAGFLLNHLTCGWAANPWCPAVQEAAWSLSCTELGITTCVRTSGRGRMDAALSNWLHLEWLHASQCFTDAFWGSLSKRQLPEDKLFLKTFGSCSKFTCQRKLCVPFLWEPLETFLLLLSAPLCFLKQVAIVFTRQEISSLASFFLHQGCFFCFLAFPFANITGFCCQLLYLLPYRAAFQPTAFPETFFTSGNQWRGNFTSSKTATRQLHAKEHFHCVQSLVGHVLACRNLHTRHHYVCGV